MIVKGAPSRNHHRLLLLAHRVEEDGSYRYDRKSDSRGQLEKPLHQNIAHLSLGLFALVLFETDLVLVLFF